MAAYLEPDKLHGAYWIALANCKASLALIRIHFAKRYLETARFVYPHQSKCCDHLPQSPPEFQTISTFTRINIRR